MKKIFSIGLLFLILFSCCSRVRKTEAEKEREEWIAGFTDSISYYKQESLKIESILDTLNTTVSRELADFEMIRNPREVSGYYIMKGWNSRIPFTTTGIYARINEHEKLELIATLGGSTFNQIETGNIKSEIVHNDQAFNYRHERFNTVYFSGEKADSIAQFIASANGGKVNLLYLEGGKTKKNFVIPSDQADMIGHTWNLYNNQSRAHKLQKELWISSRKIETFRRLMEMQNYTDNN